MKSKYLMLSLALVVVGLLFGQASVSVFAQSFEPEILGPTINSQCPDVNPILSRGGDTLFFSRIDCPANHYGAKASQDIWMSVRGSDGSFGPAKRLPNSVNIGRYNALHAALDDGSYLISGIFDKKGTSWLRNGFSLIRPTSDSTWSVPTPLKVPGDLWGIEGDLGNAHMSPDGKYLFLAHSRRWQGKDLKLYVAKQKKAGKYSRPKKLKGPMEGFQSAEAPRYCERTGRLYFSGRQEGSDALNMYYVTPAGEDTTTMLEWGNLTQLSDTVHIASWNSYFTPDPTGAFALLCANRADSDTVSNGNGEAAAAASDEAMPEGVEVGASGSGRADIYQAMLVETRPWVQVKGRLIDSRTNDLLESGREVAVYLNGQKSDSVTLIEGNKFFALLPLDSVYRFSASLTNFTSDTAVVDVTGRRLYTQDSVDITLTTLPFVRVHGTIFDSFSLAAIDPKFKPEILVDDKVIDTLRIDPVKSTYEVKLLYGHKHTFLAKATEYEGVPVEVDLTPFTEYSELKMDLFAKPMNANMVTLYGKIINTKTGQPLTPGVPVKMRVNRKESLHFQYNDKNASYRLMLPAGADYDLVPNVYNFYNRLEVVDLRDAKPRSKVPRDFFVTPLEVGQSVDIQNIYFETGKSKLKPESFRSLNALVDFFKEYPNVKVELGGHTDNTGSAAVNRRLSKQRAQAVADYIIEQGVSRDRFEVVGHGPSKPKASNKTRAGRAKNRRTDFTIIGI